MTTYANGHGFKLSPPEQMKFQCFEKDDIPVDIDEVFEGGHCADKNGELYKIGNVEVSCCQCIRYKCQQFGELMGEALLFWNTTVSESCCLTCNGTVVPENTKIDTEQLDDECKTIKTSFCRTFPSSNIAAIEYDFSYKNCCNDNSGYLHYINATVLEPSTCSERICFFTESLPHTVWKSNQIISGCDCCEVNGGLVHDGHKWDYNGDFYECCRGEIVKKVEGANSTSPEATQKTTTTFEMITHEERRSSSSSSSFSPDFDPSPSSLKDCVDIWRHGWKSHGTNLFYKYFEEVNGDYGNSWHYTANRYCKSRWNAKLPSVHDRSLNTFLAYLSGGKPTWIGGRGFYRFIPDWLNGTKVREYSWMDGSEWDYTNWNPSTNRSTLYRFGVAINWEGFGLWNDVNKYAENVTGYICQKTCSQM